MSEKETINEKIEWLISERKRLISKLIEIKSMRDNGVISQKEFDTLYHPVREDLDILEDLIQDSKHL